MTNIQQRRIAYHKAIIKWHTLAVKALEQDIPKELIYRHTIPINILNPDLINQYIDSLSKEVAAYLADEPSPYPVVKL